MANDKLKKLQEQKHMLETRIRQEQGKEKARTRKSETRKKILAGAAVLDQAEKHPEYKKHLFDLIDRFYKRTDDRALFGLPPLPESDAGETLKKAEGITKADAEEIPKIPAEIAKVVAGQ